MRVLVCGSRGWTDSAMIVHVLGRWSMRDDVEVIHGAANGADRLAASIAEELRYSVRAFPADWSGLGKCAGFVRNLAMLDEEPDLVLAFQLDGSRGTQHTINEARRRNIPVEVFAHHTSASSGSVGEDAPHA